MNPMQKIKVEKLTLNIGAGKDQDRLKRGMKLLKNITGIEPVQTVSHKRIPSWGVRPGLPVGCKLTLRGKLAEDLVPRLLGAKEHTLMDRNFDEKGNVSFGIPEYIDIDGVEYDPDIGITGLEASITLARPGFRVKKRRLQPASIGRKHRIRKEEAQKYMQDAFKVKMGEEEE